MPNFALWGSFQQLGTVSEYTAPLDDGELNIASPRVTTIFEHRNFSFIDLDLSIMFGASRLIMHF